LNHRARPPGGLQSITWDRNECSYVAQTNTGATAVIITPESKIQSLELSDHAENCLADAGIVYLFELLMKPGAELRVFCDDRAFDEIKARLREAGLKIGGGLE
jgi:DNA-directed RNA polymerase alpha subunit